LLLGQSDMDSQNMNLIIISAIITIFILALKFTISHRLLQRFWFQITRPFKYWIPQNLASRSLKAQNRRDAKSRERKFFERCRQDEEDVVTFFNKFTIALNQKKSDDYLLEQSYYHAHLVDRSGDILRPWYLTNFNALHDSFQDVSKKFNSSKISHLFLINYGFLHDLSSLFRKDGIIKGRINHVNEVLEDEYHIYNWNGSKLNCVEWYLNFLEFLYSQGNETLDLIFSLQAEVDKLDDFQKSYNDQTESSQNLLEKINNLTQQVTINANYAAELVRKSDENLNIIDRYLEKNKTE